MTKLPFIRRHLIKIVLIAFIAMMIAGNIIWISRDQSPPLWDMAAHSSRAVDFGNLITSFHPRTILQYDTIYPPATYLWTGALFAMFGPHEDIPQLSLLLYLFIYIISVYLLACTLFNKPGAGLLAGFLSFGLPLLTHFSRVYDLDYPQTALTSLAVLALVRSRLFSSRFWTVVLAVCLAAGLLTKWTFPIFLIGPLIVLIATRSGWRKLMQRHVVINIALGVAIVSALAGPWYGWHYHSVLASAVQTRNNVFSVPYENLLSVDNVIYYAVQTLRGFTWPLFIFGLAGVCYALIRRTQAAWLLLGWIFVPYIIMTFFIYSKESRYFLPAYPAIALLTSYFILSFNRRTLRISVSVLAVSLSLAVGVESATGSYVLPYRFYERIGMYRQYGYFDPSTQEVGYGFTRPTIYQTTVKNIPAAIKDDLVSKNRHGTKPRIAVVPNSIFLTAAQIQYYSKLIGLDSDYRLSSLIRSTDYQKFLEQADYVITKTGDQGPKVWAPPALTDIQKASDSPSSELFKNYEIIKTWRVTGIEAQPQTVRLYRKTSGCNCNK